MRNAEKGKNALKEIKSVNPNANVVVKILDMAEFSNIRDFVKQIFEEYEKIDILINNAGTISQPYKKTADGNEVTFVTNYLGM